MARNRIEDSLVTLVVAATRAAKPDLDLIAHLTATPLPKTVTAAPAKGLLDKAHKLFDTLKGKFASTGEEEKPGVYKFVSMVDVGGFWRALRAEGIPAKTDPYHNIVMVGANVVQEIQEVLKAHGRPGLCREVAALFSGRP